MGWVGEGLEVADDVAEAAGADLHDVLGLRFGGGQIAESVECCEDARGFAVPGDGAGVEGCVAEGDAGKLELRYGAEHGIAVILKRR